MSKYDKLINWFNDNDGCCDWVCDFPEDVAHLLWDAVQSGLVESNQCTETYSLRIKL